MHASQHRHQHQRRAMCNWRQHQRAALDLRASTHGYQLVLAPASMNAKLHSLSVLQNACLALQGAKSPKEPSARAHAAAAYRTRVPGGATWCQFERSTSISCYIGAAKRISTATLSMHAAECERAREESRKVHGR